MSSIRVTLNFSAESLFCSTWGGTQRSGPDLLTLVLWTWTQQKVLVWCVPVLGGRGDNENMASPRALHRAARLRDGQLLTLCSKGTSARVFAHSSGSHIPVSHQVHTRAVHCLHFSLHCNLSFNVFKIRLYFVSAFSSWHC